MTDEELIPRLRELRGTYGIGDTAADRIEALVKERDAVIEARDMMGRFWSEQKARAEAAEAALKEAVEVVKACDWKFEHDGFAEDSIARMTTRAFLAKHGSQK